MSFLHRFGSSLNPHFYFHLCVLDGLFEEIPGDAGQDPADLETRLRFHEATGTDFPLDLIPVSQCGPQAFLHFFDHLL